MSDIIVFDTGKVFDFVASKMPFNAVSGMTGIGLQRHGAMVSGVIYEGFNGKNIWMHVAAEPGGRWLTREYMRVCFAYPFIQCGVDRISGYVNASNKEARRFDEHLGFIQEATLQGAAADGGDVIIYVMRRNGCRYVDPK